jgi:hypothetical protein
MDYQEYEHKIKVVDKKTMSIFMKIYTENLYLLKGLSYSKIELFTEMLKRTVAKEARFTGVGFEIEPMV